MILLATLNSTYQHSAFGLRYLFANLGDLQSRTKIMEFTIGQDVRVIAEQILAQDPKILGLGVYIWNARPTLDLVSLLKKLRPGLIVVLGGPEVSFETESQEIFKWSDYVIKGEADFLFADFCQKVLQGVMPPQKLIQGPLPDIGKIQSPYSFYSDDDIKNRVIYVEASRGCPYKCEYCLSSLDVSVRNFPIESFLKDLDLLIKKGARQFKFVDRTFNLSPKISMSILNFFLERMDSGLFLHFEMVPDRLPAELKELIKKFPPGALQFEIGIQTWNPEVAKNVSRRQDYSKIAENFQFLKSETKVHTHADLIVGLPGETLESFAQGFDQLAACGPDEIQVGLLKRLKGTPIVRHDQNFQMIYQSHPPFQILSTKDMNYSVIQKMVRFSKFWDLYANSGNFPHFMEFLKKKSEGLSYFSAFMAFVDFLSLRHPEGHGIALLRLVESAWVYLTEICGLPAEESRAVLVSDYSGTVKRDLPGFLKEKNLEDRPQRNTPVLNNSIPKRQLRHLATSQVRS
jgi:radical SAM superfamily enzyme YgiQ (UPF0313 family)